MSDTKAKRPTVSINAIKFSGGQTIALEPNDIVVIVGPNNCGKSRTLREIYNTLSGHQKASSALDQNLVVKDFDLEKVGSANELLQFMIENAQMMDRAFRYGNVSLGEYAVSHFDSELLGDTAHLFRVSLDAHSRLALANTVNGASSANQMQSPQHLLYDDERLIEHVSELFHAAFGEQLFFDFRATPEIPIHVGKKPRATKNFDRVSNNYVEKVRSFPRIDTQGDGMKSYAGILFQIVAYRRDMTFIDEPEAFLHPPQMRRLGKTLAEESIGQLFIATHSTDILRGLLESSSNRVRVIRLQRSGSINNARELNPEQIRMLWAHPQIKYSTALDSIFHEQALICEDDSDCRLYSAVAEHLEKAELGIRWKDTHYVPTGGKAAVPRITAALRNLGVPIKVIFDLDLLADESGLRLAYESAGGNWSQIEKKWKALDADIRQGVKVKDDTTIRTEIISLLQSQEGGLPKSQIQDLMKQDKPWATIKKLGKSAIPRGNAIATFESINKSLRDVGIFVVELGEAESFCPEIGKHGPEFVMNLLERKDLGEESLSPLRDFVRAALQS